MEQFPLRWFRSSVCPNHNNPQTKPDCRPYRQSRVGCRFGRSGSSEKRKPRACISYTLYVGIGGFMQATASYSPNNVSLNKLSSDSYNISISDES